MQKFFMENVCLKTEKKVLKHFQIDSKSFFLSPSKNASHSISIYRNCMISIFSQPKTSVFFITKLFYQNQTAEEISLNLFSTIFRNCLKIVGEEFFLTLDVWNCMTSIFCVWRSTRELI